MSEENIKRELIKTLIDNKFTLTEIKTVNDLELWVLLYNEKLYQAINNFPYWFKHLKVYAKLGIGLKNTKYKAQ